MLAIVVVWNGGGASCYTLPYNMTFKEVFLYLGQSRYILGSCLQVDQHVFNAFQRPIQVFFGYDQRWGKADHMLMRFFA